MTYKENSRDASFDVLKGFGIIAVIVDHCNLSPYFDAFIDSFHMPLFFFVAGYFFKERTLKAELSLSFKRLIVPYIFVAFCVCLIAICTDLFHYAWADGSYSQGKIVSYLMGYNGQVNPNWLSGDNGMLWFILAMFWARFLMCFFVRKIKSAFLLGFLLFLLGIIGIILNKFFTVPFCIPQGMCATGFVFTGYLLKKNNVLETSLSSKLIPFLGVLWLCSIGFRGVAMFKCSFPTGYIFGLCGALGGWISLHVIAKNYFNVESVLWRFFHFCGKYSLVVYCVHAVEYASCNWKFFSLLLHIPLDNFELFQLAGRLIVIFFFTMVLLKIKPVREQIFQIKNYIIL